MSTHCGIGVCTPIPVEPSGIEGVARLSMLTPEWHRARSALLMPLGYNVAEVYADGLEVGMARNAAVQKAMSHGMKYLFFNDWDTIIPRETLVRLVYYLDNYPDYDVACGMYCAKSTPPYPLLWKEWGHGVCWDWTMGDVIKEGVVGVPMGCTLLRLSLFEKLPFSADNPWFKTTDGLIDDGDGAVPEHSTEDLWFCRRLNKELHGKIMVDTGLFCEHIDHVTGVRFTLPEDSRPRRRAKEAADKRMKVLHVGCGPEMGMLPCDFDAEHWKEIRLDVDPAVKPDVVSSMTDMRAVQSGSVDAIWCHHSMEHLAYHEVPLALAEFFRVLKPGGQAMVVVPDIQAVVAEVVKGNLEKVLYESPAGPICAIDILYGYRNFIAGGNHHQCHKTAFSAESATEKFSAAGFVDVRTRTGEGWNLFIQAGKPAVKEG